MFIMPSFKKSLIVEQFQGNYLKEMLPQQGVHLRDVSMSGKCLSKKWY